MEISMGFRQEPRLEQSQALSTRLTQKQRLALKQLQLLQQKLVAPEFPNAIRGLEGIMTGHRILQDNGSVGLLIGGLAESVWNRYRTEHELSLHKDTDIMILDDNYKPEDFEEGIDWWVPYEERITIDKGGFTRFETNQRWYENAHGIMLFFGAEKTSDLPPGLYIPGREFILNMKVSEVMADIDFSKIEVDIDEKTVEKFGSLISRRIKTRLPTYLAREMEGFVLDPEYTSYHESKAIQLVELDKDTIIGVNRYKLE